MIASAKVHEFDRQSVDGNSVMPPNKPFCGRNLNITRPSASVPQNTIPWRSLRIALAVFNGKPSGFPFLCQLLFQCTLISRLEFSLYRIEALIIDITFAVENIHIKSQLLPRNPISWKPMLAFQHHIFPSQRNPVLKQIYPASASAAAYMLDSRPVFFAPEGCNPIPC